MTNSIRNLLLAALLTAGCTAADADAGQETAACLDGACFGDLECRSDFCVDPNAGDDTEGNDDDGDDDDSASGQNPSGTSASTTTSDPTAGATSGASASATSPVTTAATTATTDADPTTGGVTTQPASSGPTEASESDTADESTTTGDDTTTGGSEPVCGNGAVEPGEQCDGADLQGYNCSSLGLGTGDVGCTFMCTFDTSMCMTTTSGTSG